MRLEHTLAKRYITAQKRHSILTISSIAIAIVIIVVISIALSTVLRIGLNVNYDKNPYHVVLSDVTQEQADALAKQPGIKSCTIRESVLYEGLCKTEGLLFLNHSVKNVNETIKNAAETVGMKDYKYSINESALFLEGIGNINVIRLLVSLSGIIILILFIMFALRLIIDTAFEVSSHERERQFGVLQSIGATPTQIVNIITHEGLILSLVGIPLGIGLGIGVAYLVYRLIINTGVIEAFVSAECAARVAEFYVNPLFIAIAAAFGLVWVFFSAYGTGMRIIRMSPMDAIRGKNHRITKSRKHRLAGLLFGWVGKLSAKNIRRQPKRFIITVLSMVVSMTLFSTFGFLIDSAETVLTTFTIEWMGGGDVTYDLFLYMPIESSGILSYKKPMQQLEDSGYFKIIDCSKVYPIHINVKDGISVPIEYANICGINPEDKQTPGNIIYYPKEVYLAAFDGNPPVPYEELAKNNQYILQKEYVSRMTYDGETEFYTLDIPNDLHNVTFPLTMAEEITQAEYDKLKEADEPVIKIPISDEQTENTKFYKKYDSEIELEIGGVFDPLEYYGEDVFGAKLPYIYANGPTIIGTIEQFEASEYHLFEKSVYQRKTESIQEEKNFVSVDVSLKDTEQYDAAIKYLRETLHAVIEIDLVAQNKKTRAILSSIKIAMGAGTVLIALIAVVNLINIVSTSLLNRKREFAAMQSVGMSQKQLMKLTLIEALQYVLISGVFAVLLCECVVWITRIFLQEMTLSIPGNLSYTTFLPRLLAAAVAALLTTFIATIIPMQQLKKESIVDNIRGIE